VNFLRVALACLRREILEEISYRFAIVLGAVGLFVSLFFIWVFAEFVGVMVEDKLQHYQGGYFAFVVFGIGLYSFLQATLFQLSRRIRQAQVVGTLEALLGTRTRLSTILLCMPLFPLLETSLYVLGILLLGTLFFGLPLDAAGLPAVLLAAPFALAAFAGLGLVGAGLTVAFKRAEAVPLFLANISLFLGGVWYPVEALPAWLQRVAAFLPLTHALEVMRSGLLAGASPAQVSGSILALAATAIVLLPLGFVVLRWSVRRAMRDGTLTQY
jgi:ABC-2 type transport system permease protein